MRMKRRLSAKSAVVFGVGLSASCLVQGQEISAGSDQTERIVDAFHRVIAEHESALRDPLSVEFEIDVGRNLLGPDKGRHTKQCRYSVSDGVVALSVETRYHEPPPYRSREALGYRNLDFDVDGNLTVWRSLKKVALSTRHFNRTYEEYEMLRVEPHGSIEQNGRHVIIYEYPIGSREHLYEVEQFWMVSGRGPADRIGQFKTERALTGNVHELVFQDDYRGMSRGDWYVYVRQSADFLVRQADLFDVVARRNLIHIENMGTVEAGGITVARRGSVRYAVTPGRDYVLGFRVLDVRQDVQPEEIDGIRSVVRKPFPPDAEIVDYREDPPRRYHVDE